MKLITLTKYGGSTIHIQPMMIIALEPQASNNRTNIYMMGEYSWVVLETIEEIKKKIKDLDKYIHFDPKDVTNA